MQIYPLKVIQLKSTPGWGAVSPRQHCTIACSGADVALGMRTHRFFSQRFLAMLYWTVSGQMKRATGKKTRSIKSTSVHVNDLFEFNKSIVPHGGKSSILKLRRRRNGSYVIKLFQDLNNDRRVSKNELIYKGLSRVKFQGDNLTDFKGQVRLEKSMHRCEWMTAKYPKELIPCTREYIPTTYSCLLVDSSGARFKFDGIGDFAANTNFLVDVLDK